jgi:hypothetical protein
MPQKMTLEKLAQMVGRGFIDIGGRVDKLDGKLDKFIAENKKEHQEIRRDISALIFIATEMARREELIEVKKRLEKVEAKLGLRK